MTIAMRSPTRIGWPMAPESPPRRARQKASLTTTAGSTPGACSSGENRRPATGRTPRTSKYAFRHKGGIRHSRAVSKRHTHGPRPRAARRNALECRAGVLSNGSILLVTETARHRIAVGLRVKCDDACRLGEREREQDHGVDQCEDRRRGADAQRECQDSGHRVAGGVPKEAKCISDVVQHHSPTTGICRLRHSQRARSRPPDGRSLTTHRVPTSPRPAPIWAAHTLPGQIAAEHSKTSQYRPKTRFRRREYCPGVNGWFP